MRLAYCYECQTLSKIDDAPTQNPDDDYLLQDWIDRHMHGKHIDDHKGGRVFNVDTEQQGLEESKAMDAIERKAVEEVRAELAKVNAEVFNYRDELREEATKCHRRHGQPHAPGKMCIDYRSDSKRLGSKKTFNELAYLCTYCPYTSSITVEVRRRRGDYNR